MVKVPHTMWFCKVVYTHNTTGRDTQHHVHEGVYGTTHEILEPHNGNIAVFIKNF
jgi:hypothetical protein